jgi:hypothetical protein
LTTRTALTLLGSSIGLILGIAANTLFRVAAPRAYGLTFGLIGLGIGAWLFVVGVGMPDGGWTVLGGFALGSVYLSAAVASFAEGGGRGASLSRSTISAETVGGVAGGVGGAYLLQWIPGDFPGNVVGVALGTAVGAMVSAAVFAPAPDHGHGTRARERAVTAAGTLFLAYFAVVAVNGLTDTKSLLPLPRPVARLTEDLFDVRSPQAATPDGRPDMDPKPEAVEVDCGAGKAGRTCVAITIHSTGGEPLILTGIEDPGGMKPWDVFAPDHPKNTCLLGKPYAHGEQCELLVQFTGVPPSKIVIHQNKSDPDRGTEVSIPAPDRIT